MMMKFSMRSIPAAAAMTAALVFGAQVQAQTTTPPTAAGDKAAMPAGPNTTPKTMEQRDMAKPMAKPMAKSGAMSGTTAGGDAATSGEPVRQADKVAKNKGERMQKSSKPKAKMTKSGEPTREAELKEQTNSK
jgi:hypothetical protein